MIELIKNSKKQAAKQLGAYKLISRLSSAGEAEEWLAKPVSRQARSADRVVVKLLTGWESNAPSETFINRFNSLTKALAPLDHPLCWPVLQVGQDGRCFYLVSPYRPDAMSLKTRLEKGKLAPLQVRNLVCEILEVLDFAHRRGVMHGALNPSNLLVFPVGGVAVQNFGLVKFEHENAGAVLTHLASPDPAYQAPEQFMGCGDFRSDLYAVGVLLYWLLTGELPFEADTMLELGRKHLNAPLPLPHPGIPAPLGTFLSQALSKRPKDRFTTAYQMGTAFERAASSLLPPTGQLSVEQAGPIYSSTNSTELISM